VIDKIDGAQLAAYTRTVLENSPYRDSLLDKASIEKGNPVPQTPGGARIIERTKNGNG